MNTLEPKLCTRCNRTLSLENFGKNQAKIDGLDIYCKECNRQHSKKWRSENPEKHRIKNLTWGRSPQGRLQKAYLYYLNYDKSRSFQTATKDEIVKVLSTGKCFYCGLFCNVGVDRIDNTKGHVVGNMLPCCGLCNLSRGNRFTVEEMVGFIGPAVRLVKEARNNA